MANMQQWLTADPLIGEAGTTAVKVTAKAYDGRVARSSDINFRTDGDTVVVTRKVTQSGRPAYVEINGSRMTVPSTGGSQVIEVKSNCEGLQIVVSGAGASISGDSYQVGSDSVGNNDPIPGDPGASGEFTAEVTVVIPANTTTSERTYELKVRGKYGSLSTDPAVLTIVQTGAAPALTVTPESVTLGYDGSEEGTFNVTSNTDWLVD